MRTRIPLAQQALLKAVSAPSDDPDATQFLVEKAQNGATPDVRLGAIDRLARLPAHDTVLETLAHLTISESDETLRAHAVLALGRLAQQGVRGAPAALARAEADPNPAIHYLATVLLRAQ